MPLTKKEKLEIIELYKRRKGEGEFAHRDRVHMAIGSAFVNAVNFSRPDFKRRTSPRVAERMLYLAGLIVPNGSEFALLIHNRRYKVPNSNPRNKKVIY